MMSKLLNICLGISWPKTKVVAMAFEYNLGTSIALVFAYADCISKMPC